MSVVLVTGSSSGFGELTALAFARKGATVYASMRNCTSASRLVAQAKSEELQIQPIALDVTKPQSIEAAVKSILSESGRIDVLVNNAGIECPGPFEDTPEADFRRVMETNFFGPYLVTRAVLPAMRDRQAGCIIMVSSLSALVGLPCSSAYTASKFALEGATECLRHEVGRFNIRVTLIEPGRFDTPMGDKLAETGPYPSDSPYKALMDFQIQKIRDSLGSGDDPNLVAELIVRVASEEHPSLRYPAGLQAERITKTIHSMSDEERAGFVVEVSGTGWWKRGQDEP